MNAAGGSAISDEIKKSVGKTIENCSGARCTDTPHDDSGGSGSGGGGSHHSSKHHHKGNAGFDTGSVSRTLGGDSSNAIETGTAPTPTTTDDNGVLNLQISNVKVFKNLAMNSYDVVGKVSNNDTTTTADTVTVSVQFFDKDDTLLGSNSDGTDSLAPGQVWSFKISAFPEIIEN